MTSQCQGTKLCTKPQQPGTYPQHAPLRQSCSWLRKNKPDLNAHGSVAFKCLIVKAFGDLSTSWHGLYLLLLSLLKRLKKEYSFSSTRIKKIFLSAVSTPKKNAWWLSRHRASSKLKRSVLQSRHRPMPPFVAVTDSSH